jgi:signal transduction histidine kinase
MLMQIQSMQRSLAAGKPVNVAEKVDKLAKSGQRLESLLGQMLDVSRISTGRLNLEPESFDLVALVHEVVARFADESAKANSVLLTRGLDRLEGYWDRLRIDQVLTNLLSNALKYGRGKPVEIDVATEEGSAVVRVIDHGIGIDAEHQKRLFMRFERAVATREYGGFGLGLWITRQIVDASGGTIGVTSEPNRGSTFTFRLPLITARSSPSE